MLVPSAWRWRSGSRGHGGSFDLFGHRELSLKEWMAALDHMHNEAMHAVAPQDTTRALVSLGSEAQAAPPPRQPAAAAPGSRPPVRSPPCPPPQADRRGAAPAGRLARL